MTEIDMLKRAKMYIDCLSEGTDPISGLEVPQDSVLNNVRLSRCFFYVSSILQKVIDNGGAINNRQTYENRTPFSITADETPHIPASDTPMPVSQLCRYISDITAHNGERALAHRTVTAWLAQKGYLSVESHNGKTRKRVTRLGADAGMYEELREGQYGQYYAVVYDKKAQQLVIDNLPEIVNAPQTGFASPQYDDTSTEPFNIS